MCPNLKYNIAIPVGLFMEPLHREKLHAYRPIGRKDSRVTTKYKPCEIRGFERPIKDKSVGEITGLLT
jgi:hypothetical protein